jgi:superfamily II DNA/RNA helicase
VRRAQLPRLEPVYQNIPVRGLNAEENLKVISPLHRLGVSKDRGALDWLRDFLKDEKGKVVILAHHNRVVEALSEGLEISAVYGKTSPGARERFLADFCDPAGTQVLVLSDDVMPDYLPRLSAVVLVELLNTPLEQFALAKYLDGNWYCLVAPDNLDYARWERMDTRLQLVRKVLDGKDL